MNSINDIQLPSLPKGLALKNTFEFIDELIRDIILYFAYGIALLCGFKFIIYILNGFTTKSHLGPSAMDDSSFLR
jgi:hypothetical protein